MQYLNDFSKQAPLVGINSRGFMIHLPVMGISGYLENSSGSIHHNL
jgi:hypothetical protein